MRHTEQTRTDRFKTAILLLAATGLIARAAVHIAGQPAITNRIRIAGTFPAQPVLVVEILRNFRSGELGLDNVAALA
jgi:hypothetical protein